MNLLFKDLGVLSLIVAGACHAEFPAEGNSQDEAAVERQAVCSDPRYGNGTCDTDLTCGAATMPDIDCFRTFQSPVEAQAWYVPMHQLLHPSNTCAADGEPVPGELPELMGVNHPFTKRAQAQLDEVWRSYKAVRPYGALAQARPYAVVFKSDEANAFVIPDTNEATRAAFAVIVHSALMDRFPDAELRAFIAHELGHTLNLHTVNGSSQKVTKWYVAPPGQEPYGKDQVNDPVLAEAGEEWRSHADTVGWMTSPKLGSMPFQGWADDMFSAGLKRLAPVSPACNATLNLIDAFRERIWFATNPLDWNLNDRALPAELAETLMDRVEAACFANQTFSLVEVVAAQTCQAVSAIELSPEERAAFVSRNFLGQLRWVIRTERERMREIEATVQARRVAWGQVRFFTAEEQADNYSSLVMKSRGEGAGLMGDALLRISPEMIAPCDDVLELNAVPPYGTLADDHHGSCYRKYLGDRLGQDQAFRSRATSTIQLGGSWAVKPTTAIRPVTRKLAVY